MRSSQVRDFQRTVADLREKGRKFDETLQRAKTAEKKYDDLRKLAEDQASALNNAADNEKKVVQKSLDSEVRFRWRYLGHNNNSNH